MSRIENSNLSLKDIYFLLENPEEIKLNDSLKTKINQSFNRAQKMAKDPKPIYGINTGVGPLCTTKISPEETKSLQRNLLLSHSVGVGNPISPELSRIMLLCKIKSLSRGFSGISLDLLDRLIYFLQHNLTPVVPEKGSVGASGDLAPLAHLFLPVIGEGFFWNGNEKIKSKTVLKQHKLKPLDLNAKEGLALINGTQFILAHAIKAISKLDYLMDLADLAAAMSLEGFQGSLAPFRKELHELRPYKGSIKVANRISNLLDNSQNSNSHIDCDRVQDPYSIRCTPQVHGASRNALNHLKELVTIEINSVTDNPIILDDNSAISGGNFHGQPLALALDYLKIAASEIGNISDRRSYLLLEGLHGLPPMLTENPGLNSGFMITQYTTAALVSENKSLCFPASVDSIPTGMGQEDHVSMGSISARICLEVINNLEKILAIELLHSAQSLEFRRPNKFSLPVEKTLSKIRKNVKKLEGDRVLSIDIEVMINLIEKQDLNVFPEL
ncbi:MAG: histidine ammonia-lyase [Flavobacteriales bacterium]|jgi:histidine ammonia-lyase|nr:histidine ammonia-lyase [Flavobacteriales bacterium]